jgi:hypothetical protein
MTNIKYLFLFCVMKSFLSFRLDTFDFYIYELTLVSFKFVYLDLEFFDVNRHLARWCVLVLCLSNRSRERNFSQRVGGYLLDRLVSVISFHTTENYVLSAFPNKNQLPSKLRSYYLADYRSFLFFIFFVIIIVHTYESDRISDNDDTFRHEETDDGITIFSFGLCHHVFYQSDTFENLVFPFSYSL